jgi:hypothetical protein
MQSSVALTRPGALVKASARQVLASLGFEVLKTRTLNAYLSRYDQACSELESLFRQTLFPDLPEQPGRVGLMTALQGTGPSEAMWLLRHLHASLALPGDVCEFGVAQGATSALMANEIRGTSKLLWLFDSFKGLPRPSAQDVLLDDIYGLGSIERYAGQMVEGSGQVINRLRDIAFPSARTRIVAGFIEETVAQPGLAQHVCFAYVDFDFYEPIKIALEFLATRLSDGGYVVVDDYGHFSAGAQTAVDEFIGQHADAWALTLPSEFAGHFAILQKHS